MAEVTFTSKLGNDTSYGKLAAPLRQVLIDNAGDNTMDEKLLRKLFVVQTSDNFAEASTGQNGLTLMQRVAEGGQITSQQIQETFKKIIEHESFGARVTVTMEMLQDARAGMFSKKAKPLFASLGNSYVRTRCEMATKALCAETGTTFEFAGFTFDRTSPDGLPIFSKSHKIYKTGATQSNIFANKFSATVLNQLASKGRNLKNDTGDITCNLFDTIIIPGNAPNLETLVKAAIYSERVPGSANNDINTQNGQWSLVVNPYWQADNDQDDTHYCPFIIQSSKGLENTCGSSFFDRTGLLVKESEDDDFNVITSAKARNSCGFFDYRHVVMGGAGTTNGTSL